MDPHAPPTGLGHAPAPPVPDILEEHLEEVGFLSLQRRKLLFATGVNLAQLEGHDGRIEAHLDGLRIGGAAAVEMAAAHLGGDDPWQVYAAARVWLAQGNPAPEAVLEAIGQAGGEAVSAWREALRRTDPARVEPLRAALAAGDLAGPALAVALDGLGWHGRLGPDAPARLAASDAPEVRRALARALGHGHPPPFPGVEALGYLLDDPDLAVRRAALWSLALSHPSDALARCRAATREADPFAARVLGLLGTPDDLKTLARLAAGGPARLAAIHAIGDLGHPGGAGLLVDFLTAADAEVVAAAETALAAVLGSLPPGPPPADPTADATVPPEAARAAVERTSARLGGDGRWLGGARFPWDGPPAEAPMACLWRAAVAGRGGPGWLRREVPDGFFEAQPRSDAVPGE